MSEMFKISLPDGSVREMPHGSTPADVAAAIGPGLAKAALAARIDGELRDLNRPFEGDSQLALVTSRDEKDALELVRHDFAHILAEAVQNLYPGTQITFGPAFTQAQSGTINDAAGLVDNLSAATPAADVGDDQYALLARVRFAPTGRLVSLISAPGSASSVTIK